MRWRRERPMFPPGHLGYGRQLRPRLAVVAAREQGDGLGAHVETDALADHTGGNREQHPVPESLADLLPGAAAVVAGKDAARVGTGVDAVHRRLVVHRGDVTVT